MRDVGVKLTQQKEVYSHDLMCGHPIVLCLFVWNNNIQRCRPSFCLLLCTPECSYSKQTDTIIMVPHATITIAMEMDTIIMVPHATITIAMEMDTTDKQTHKLIHAFLA